MLSLDSCKYISHGTERMILDINSLTVNCGEQLIIVGPSGSGKTTLLQALTGLLFQCVTEKECTGQLYIEGQPVSSDVSSLKDKRIAYLSQDLALWPHLTCLEHLSFVLTYGRSLKNTTGKKWLDLVRLGHRYESSPHQLSGGEQKRLALARVLASRPRYLFLDEPFANIDLVLAQELMDIIDAQHEKEKFALITVTHHKFDTKADNSRIVVLNEGRIIQTGAFQEIKNNPVNDWVANWTRLVE